MFEMIYLPQMLCMNIMILIKLNVGRYITIAANMVSCQFTESCLFETEMIVLH